MEFVASRGCHSIVRRIHYVVSAQNYTKIKNIDFVRFEGFHGDDYEECHLLGCYAVWLL
jgi:hypothetical protein